MSLPPKEVRLKLLIQRRLRHLVTMRKMQAALSIIKYEQLSLINHRKGFLGRGKWFWDRWDKWLADNPDYDMET